MTSLPHKARLFLQIRRTCTCIYGGQVSVIVSLNCQDVGVCGLSVQWCRTSGDDPGGGIYLEVVVGIALGDAVQDYCIVADVSIRCLDLPESRLRNEFNLNLILVT